MQAGIVGEIASHDFDIVGTDAQSGGIAHESAHGDGFIGEPGEYRLTCELPQTAIQMQPSASMQSPSGWPPWNSSSAVNSPTHPSFASKGALKTAMYYMAKELGPKKIRVNTVVPTWMWGPPVEGYVKMVAKQRGVSQDVVIGEITSRMPLGEIPSDGDVAEAVIFFCSDRARLITGQALLVNAGEFFRA